MPVSTSGKTGGEAMAQIRHRAHTGSDLLARPAAFAKSMFRSEWATCYVAVPHQFRFWALLADLRRVA